MSWPTKARHWAVNAPLRALIRAALAMPYERRVPFVGAAVRRGIGPLAGYGAKARENLARVWPDLPAERRDAIVAACLDNAGRTFIENYSSAEFPARMARNPLEGDGWAALKAAAEGGRPAILATGHYGNYEAVRAALAGRGLAVGGLYRDMSNPYFNAHYVKTMEAFGGPVFPQGRRGTAGFVRHLKEGGQLVLLFDTHMRGAPVMSFLGQPAHTALSAAELALRYGALLIPFYGIREPDGLGFRTVLEAPVEESDAHSMTAALNASLEARILEDPGQWFWVQGRWKVKKG